MDDGVCLEGTILARSMLVLDADAREASGEFSDLLEGLCDAWGAAGLQEKLLVEEIALSYWLEVRLLGAERARLRRAIDRIVPEAQAERMRGSPLNRSVIREGRIASFGKLSVEDLLGAHELLSKGVEELAANGEVSDGTLEALKERLGDDLSVLSLLADAGDGGIAGEVERPGGTPGREGEPPGLEALAAQLARDYRDARDCFAIVREAAVERELNEVADLATRLLAPSEELQERLRRCQRERAALTQELLRVQKARREVERAAEAKGGKGRRRTRAS